MRFRVFGTEVVVEQGELAAQQVDAIVTPANNYLWMGGPEALAIKVAGGETIEQQATAEGPAATGSAIVTGAGKLDVRLVIHAVVAGQDLRSDPEIVKAATHAALSAAEERHARSVALPLIGVDPGHLDPVRCADALIGALVDHLVAGSTLAEVRLITGDAQIQRLTADTAGARFTLGNR